MCPIGDVNQALEGRVVGVGDGRERPDAGIVDEHVDTAERRFRGVEHAAHNLRIAHIGFGGQGATALVFDPAGQSLGGRGIAGIVDHDGEAVARQPLRHCGANTGRGTGYDHDLGGVLGRVQFSCRSSRDIRFG